MTRLIVKVDYYDKEEKLKIEKNFPDDFPLIEAIVRKEISISYEDFKVYAVLGFQYDANGFRTFNDLSKIGQGISRFETLLHYNPQIQSLIKTTPERPVINDVSEELGIAGGLAIAGEIYSLTQADWQLIPQITSHKDFDFGLIAANHHKYINIEAKGCITAKNSVKDSAVSKHRNKIHAKKADTKFKAKYDYKTDTCLGFITVADSSNVLQVWIVDPSFNRPSMSPEVMKLLKRIYYYYSLIHSFAPKAIITTAIANRYNILQKLGDFSGLDGLPLVNSSMEKIIISEAFFQSRTTDNGNTIVGRFFFTKQQLIFIGIHTSCFNLLIGQNHDEINSFSISQSTRQTTLNGVVNKRYSNFIDRLSDRERIINRREKNSQILFNINMEVTITSSGMCFAYLHF
ncbi:hypothetical protein [Chitinophaga nivalis]|uniref:Uncharacterized protein n=1 Tax=Chitinophaga nivalis TaxID=2991709 RepID=A0ABT3IEW1_9BACT|nr:hypothetical protein [Chitinophaga nivalis]MCW3467811.1 hypothetical protein [Chitinophaga nivalis]MCW3482497.1 hypothetical protein [Chitinophaga nivalis]